MDVVLRLSHDQRLITNNYKVLNIDFLGYASSKERPKLQKIINLKNKYKNFEKLKSNF